MVYMKYQAPIICARGLPAYGVQAGASASGGKSQINSNDQARILQTRWNLKIEICKLFGIWVFGFGILTLALLPHTFSQERRSAAGERQSVDLTIYNQNL